MGGMDAMDGMDTARAGRGVRGAQVGFAGEVARRFSPHIS